MVSVCFSVGGDKGRAKNRTMNDFDACGDMSGRRLTGVGKYKKESVWEAMGEIRKGKAWRWLTCSLLNSQNHWIVGAFTS